MQPQAQEPQSVTQNQLQTQQQNEKVESGHVSSVAAKLVENGGKPGDEKSPAIKTEENQENWKVFRAQREVERKEKEAATKRAVEKEAEAAALKAALEAIVNKPSQNKQANDSTYGYNDESEDERIQKKIDAAVELRLERERRQYQEERRQQDQQELPAKIRQAFPDFNQVCSAENTDYLEYHYPEISSAFNHVPDSFEKWANVYKAIKRFVPNTDTRKDVARAEKNSQKPGSISAPGTTSGGNAMPAARLDEQRKASNWERMQKTLKGLSS